MPAQASALSANRHYSITRHCGIVRQQLLNAVHVSVYNCASVTISTMVSVNKCQCSVAGMEPQA